MNLELHTRYMDIHIIRKSINLMETYSNENRKYFK